jgi:hypothetical protein|nr:MAG TPA: hypothetical protein [Caudoviricetes sp.]
MEKDIIEIKKSDLQGLFKILTNYPQISKEQVINEMTKAFGEEALKSQDIKERIKTFEDAVNAIGEDHPLVAQYKTINSAFKEADNNLHLFAYTRLAIIAEALNEGWRPEYTEDEYRYYPWFGLYTQEEYDDMDDEDKECCRFVGRSDNVANAYGGLVCAYARYGSAYSSTEFGSRLAFKSRELAIYCGKQFIEIWINYLFK